MPSLKDGKRFYNNFKMKKRKALLVIDMQQGSFTTETPRFDTEGVVNRINSLAALFRENHWPVIFIQHDGSKEGAFIPGNEDWKLLPELEVHTSDLLVSKTANNVFYNSELDPLLKKMNIEALFISGCATDFCVESSIQAALSNNFEVTVIKDGHTTGDRPHLKAEKVIEHYNWVWSNMIPTKGWIKVLDTETIKNSILTEYF